jgi:hypothetical protein
LPLIPKLKDINHVRTVYESTEMSFGLLTTDWSHQIDCGVISSSEASLQMFPQFYMKNTQHQRFDAKRRLVDEKELVNTIRKE